MKTLKEFKKHKRKQNIIAFLILIVGISASFLIFGSRQEESENGVQEKQVPPALVKTVKLDSGTYKIAKLEKTALWEVEGNSADAISEFSGRVKKVGFEVGNLVYEGDILAVFDQSNSENSPKVTLDSAQKSYNLAQENLSDTQDLSNKTVDLAERAIEVAKIEEDQVKDSPASTNEQKDLAEQNVKIAEDREKQARRSAEIQENGARIQLEQARLALEQAQIAYENTIIRAPISGRVVSKNVNEEDFLNPGDAVASIVGSGKLEAVIYLNKDEIERIKSGDSVEIKIGESSYPGRIVSFSEIANDVNERFEVKISSDQELPEKSNRTGSVIVNIYLDETSGFFVPFGAVNIGQTKREVFVVENGKAVAKRVELGKIIGTSIEVLGGLSEGDELIVENSRNLQSGQEVRVE